MDRRFQSFSLTTQVSEFSYYLYDGLLNLLLIFWNNNLTRIFFENESKHYFQYFSKMKCQEDTGRDLVELTKQQFDEYFSGKPMDFELPMILCGTYFQNRVWKAASKICFGNVRSYAKIAKDIGTFAPSTCKGTQDCCTMYLPKHPILKGDLTKVNEFINKMSKLTITDIDIL